MPRMRFESENESYIFSWLVQAMPPGVTPSRSSTVLSSTTFRYPLMWIPWSYVTFATTLLPVMMLFTAESATVIHFQVRETVSATNREHIAS